MASADGTYGHAFWERLWRSAGIQAAGLFVIAALVYVSQPPIGASTDTLIGFYDGERVRILIAVFVFGMATLNLMWFAAALRATLAEAGKDGWGAAATASSAVVGGLLLLLVAIVCALAYAVAISADHAVTSALNTFLWAGFVLSSFPRAMLIMSGSFGLWRAGLISNALFTAGVGAVVLVLLGGSTWFDGVWAPDGLYSGLVSPIIGLVWVALVSAFLMRRPSTRGGW
jgi:hypothetical protein